MEQEGVLKTELVCVRIGRTLAANMHPVQTTYVMRRIVPLDAFYASRATPVKPWRRRPFSRTIMSTSDRRCSAGSRVLPLAQIAAEMPSIAGDHARISTGWT